jgi:hypothetical protein
VRRRSTCFKRESDITHKEKDAILYWKSNTHNNIVDQQQQHLLQKLSPAKRTTGVQAQMVGDAVDVEAVATHPGIPPQAAFSIILFVETDGTLCRGVGGVKMGSCEIPCLET